MKAEKTLTVSVAAYNISQFIDKLAESLVHADVEDAVEVLIVDDGSKDDTAKRALEYQERFPQLFRLVSKPNGGHGSTINRGIEEAKGKYFRALDGDDWVNSENLHELVENLKTVDADMVICDFDRCYSDGRIVTERFDALEKQKQYGFDEIVDKVAWLCYHTVIYRTSILKDHAIKLDEKCFYVDTEYDLFPIPFINSVYYFGKSVYCYRLGVDGQSVSPESRMKNIEHGKTVARSLLKLCNNIDNSTSNAQKQYIYYGTADHCIWHIRSLLLFNYSPLKRKEIKSFDKMIREQSEDVYKQMENQGKESRLIHALRKTNYFAYGPIKLYKSLRNSY